MDKGSPISRLADAGIGFDGSPLPHRNKLKEDFEISKRRRAAIRRRKFKAMTVAVVVGLIGAIACYFWTTATNGI